MCVAASILISLCDTITVEIHVYRFSLGFLLFFKAQNYKFYMSLSFSLYEVSKS